MSKLEKEEYDKYDDPFYIPNNTNDLMVEKIKKLTKKWGARIKNKEQS